MHQKAVTYPDLYLNGNKIERVTQFNYLGLILQANLSWNKHISHISLKQGRKSWGDGGDISPPMF